MVLSKFMRFYYFSDMRKLVFLIGFAVNFLYCTKQKDCFEISKKVKVDNRFFFYWGSLDIVNIDEFNPPAKTGEVSESDYNSYATGDMYCPD